MGNSRAKQKCAYRERLNCKSMFKLDNESLKKVNRLLKP